MSHSNTQAQVTAFYTYFPSFVFVFLKPTAKFLSVIHDAALEPTKKYSEPQTESQEIGWNTTPLVSKVLKDSALCRFREIQPITPKDIQARK